MFFGPLVFGCSILSNHPKKDLTSIGDTFVENYPNVRKLMKCCLTIKNCVGMRWNFLKSSFLQIADVHKAPYLVNYVYIPGHIRGHISQGPYLWWEGSYAYSSIGCTLHLYLPLFSSLMVHPFESCWCTSFLLGTCSRWSLKFPSISHSLHSFFIPKNGNL